MSAPSDIQFAARTAQDSQGRDYVIWAAVPIPKRPEDHPFVCASTTDKETAKAEYDLWLGTFLATNRNIRAAHDALWGFKFGRAA